VQLRIVRRSALMKAARLEVFIDVNQQLCGIVNASVTTSQRNKC
jgi:hypothetical protein